MYFVPAAFNVIAREIILLLLARGERVRGMLLSDHEEQDVRQFLRHNRVDDRLVDFVHGPMRDLDVFRSGLAGAERVFLSTDAFPGFEPHLEAAIDAVAAADPAHVVLVSVDQSGPEAPYELGRAMGRLEQRLVDHGLPTTILRALPFVLTQNIRAQADGIQRLGAFGLPFRGEPVALLDCRDIAVAGARVFRMPESIGQTYRLTGPEAVTCWELAGELTYLLGYPVRYQPLTAAAAREQMLAARMPPEHVGDFIGLFEAGAQGFLGETSPDFERLMGRPGRTVADFIADYRWAFARGEAEGQISGWLNYAN